MIAGRPYLFSDAFVAAVRHQPLAYIDVGARGGPQSPWDQVPAAALRVFGFEPDADEAARLNKQVEGQECLPTALWSGPGPIRVHLTAVPSCSSVHRPNEALLQRFAEEHAAPRRLDRVIEVDADTMDNVLQGRVRADVVKIDVQGSEGEIIAGAPAQVGRYALAVLVETWTLPVHVGQMLTHDIMGQLHEHGFQLFDIGVAAAWSRAGVHRVGLQERQQVIGLDLLYLRDHSEFDAGEPVTRFIKLAAIADVYGFPDYAMEVLESALERYPDNPAVLAGIDAIRIASATRKRSRGPVRRLARRILRREERFLPPLHE